MTSRTPTTVAAPGLALASAVAIAALLLPATGAAAQAGNAWVSFTPDPAALAVAPLALSDAGTQVVFRTADFDRDGWEDVVAVRKSQGSQLEPAANVLLMNAGGVLTDMTAAYASASDVPGDSGFLTPTNDREVAVGDLNGDGWPDVVTCVALADGLPKHLSHPRVYVNRGASRDGRWLGLRHEDARIPQLLTTGGLPVAPRFSGVGLGDVNGDLKPDLYFVDHDGTGTGIAEPPAWDLNDRLLMNDGNGFFTDETATRLTTLQASSSYGSDAVIVDLNGDGRVDIVKTSTASAPVVVRALYNNPANFGNFSAMGTSDFGTGMPYGAAFGDLNHDVLIDAVVVDQGTDRFRLGVGIDPLQRVIWSPAKAFTFVTGGDDGIGRNVHLRDLDANGWDDVLVTDVDGDAPGCGRRLHIYHNLGSVPGDFDLVLREESELANGASGTGWKGVAGMTAADATGSYDLGFGDFDLDGDIDFLLGTCSGTTYWRNNTNPIPYKCQPDLGSAGPGTMALGLCGDDLTYEDSVAELTVTGAAPGIALHLVVGFFANPTPFKDGVLVPVPFLTIIGGLGSDASGQLLLPVQGGASTPVQLAMQMIAVNGGVYEFSNALDVELGF
jgi:hypothetical protein